MIPIILTGTIAPNTTHTVHNDINQRRNEYLKCIKYYKKFSNVYFIENSTYDVKTDVDFQNDSKFKCFQFPLSSRPQNGKGYGEFEMFDQFIKMNLIQEGFVKITGRYKVENFNEIFYFIEKNKQLDIIIDTFTLKKMAISGLFYCQVEFYRNHLMDAYRDMCDYEDRWAEHVIFSKVISTKNKHFLPFNPYYTGISGSSGEDLKKSRFHPKLMTKSFERMLLKKLGFNYMWY